MGFPYKLDQIKVRERVAIARKLAGFSQIEASKRLGYANSGALSKMENIHGKYAQTPISFNFAYNLSKICGVSLDFIGTQTANPDFGSRAGHEAALLRGLQYSMQEETTRRLKGLLAAGEAFQFLNELQLAIAMIEKTQNALVKFKKLNPIFEEDQRGSANLDNTINKSAKWACKMNKKIKRMSKAKQIAAIMGSEPKPLFDETIDSILGDEKMLNDNEQMKLWGLSDGG